DPCPPAVSFDFLAHLHPREECIAARIARLGELGDVDSDQLRVAEDFLLLARDLIILGRKTHRCINALPAQKASTRSAREACISTFHFHRVFTRLFDMTPHEYVTRIRMEVAADLLKSRQDLTVTEVADRVGFASPTSFSRLFLRKFGVSPLGAC